MELREHANRTLPLAKQRRVRRLSMPFLLVACLASQAAFAQTTAEATAASPPGIEPIDVVREDFAARVSNAWCVADVSGNAISAMFLPNLAGFADLNALANAGGFDHFNVEQQITDISGAAVLGSLPRWTGVDPALGGNAFYQFDDQFPWYFDEAPAVGEWMPTYDSPNVLITGPSGEAVGFRWADAPNIGPSNAGATLTFTDFLVGVYPDHTGVRISQAFPHAQNVNFTWTFQQGNWGGGTSDTIRFGSFDSSEPGSEGSISVLGYFVGEQGQMILTPIAACMP